MGNPLSLPTRPGFGQGGPEGAHFSLDDLPGLVFKETLGGGRLLKTLLGVHDELGPLAVKVYQMRPRDAGSEAAGGATPSQGESLDPYVLPLQRTAQQLAAVGPVASHVLPFVHWEATARAAYLLRPYVAHSVYGRLGSRPFLSDAERRCLAWQMVRAVEQAHGCGVTHGDLKLENFLITSWNWVLLTDFSPFKPAMLPADNPAEFSLYFDAGSRRRCYLAPERFLDPAAAEIDLAAPPPLTKAPSRLASPRTPEKMPMRTRTAGGASTLASPASPGPAGAGQRPDGRRGPSQAADIFSLGCCLAELFLDGRPFFDLGQLLQYRVGGHDPSALLAQLPPDVRAAVAAMIRVDPAARPTAFEVIRSLGPTLVPQGWEPLYNTVSRWGPVPADRRAADLVELAGRLLPLAAPQHEGCRGSGGTRRAAGRQGPTAEEGGAAGAGGLDRVMAETDELSSRLMRGHEVEGLSPQVLSPQGRDGALPGWDLGGDSMQLPTSSAAASAAPSAALQTLAELMGPLVCSTLRGCTTVETRTAMLVLLGSLSPLVGPSTRVGRLLPYALSAATDPHSSQVRFTALRALSGSGGFPGGLLPSLDSLPSHEGEVFLDYLLPSLSAVAGEPEDLVKDEAIAVLAEVAWAAKRVEEGAEAGAGAGAQGNGAGSDATSGQGKDRVASGAHAGQGAESAPPPPQLHGRVSEALRRQIDDLISHSMCTPWTRSSLLVRLLLGRAGGGVGAGLGADAGSPADARSVALSGPTAPSSLLPIAPHPLGFSDDVLGLAITFLNDRDAWHARATFFSRIGHLAPLSSEAFLLPLLEEQIGQGTEGDGPAVSMGTAAALQCVVSMASRGTLSRRSLLRLCPRILPLLRHASPSVQHAAGSVLEAACTLLPRADAFVFLRPLVKQAVALPPAARASDPEVMVRALRSREAQLSTPLLAPSTGRRVPDRLNPNAGYLPEERPAAASTGTGAAHQAQGSSGGGRGGTSIGSGGAPPVASASGRGDGTGRVAASEPRALTRDLLGRPLLVLDVKGCPRWTVDLPAVDTTGPIASLEGPGLSPTGDMGLSDGLASPEGPEGSPRRFESGFRRARNWARRQLAQSAQVTSAVSMSALHSAASARLARWQASSGILQGYPGGGADRVFPSPGGTTNRYPGGPGSSQLGSSSYAVLAAVATPQLLTALARLDVPQAGYLGGGDGSSLDSRARPRTAVSVARQLMGGPVPGLDEGLGNGMSGPLGAGLVGAEPSRDNPPALRRSAASLAGLLVGHFTEHQGSAVNRVAVSSGGGFFTTASDDGMCRVFQSSYLDPQREWDGVPVYSGHEGRGHVISCVCIGEAGAGGDASLVASAADDGSLHVWDVEALGLGGPGAASDRALVTSRSLGDAAVGLEASGRVLICSSRDGRVCAWDLRCPSTRSSEAWSLSVPCWKGLPRHLLIDPVGGGAAAGGSGPCWVCVGSSRGHVGLWDTRFLREVSYFRHPTTPWIEAMALCKASDSRLGLQSAVNGGPGAGQPGPAAVPEPSPADPSTSGRPRAYVASAHHEVALWDVVEGRCIQVYKVVGPEEPEEAVQEAPAALGGISQAIRGPGGYGPAAQPSAAMPGRSTSVRCMLPFANGQLLTAGNDLSVRLWDASQPSRSRVLVGRPRGLLPFSSEGGEEEPALVQQVSVRQVLGVPVVEEVTRRRPGAIPMADCMLPGGPGVSVGRLEGHITQVPSHICHVDRVLHMGWLEAPWNDSYLLTCSRDGVVKAWR